MKKSFSIFELILSLVLISIISLTILSAIKNLYYSKNITFKTNNIYLELDNTKNLIQNELLKNINIQVSNNQISFFKVDDKNLRFRDYIDIIDLNTSTQNILVAPKSNFKYTTAKFITFDKKHLCKIDKFEKEKIYIQNNCTKIASQYFLINSLSKIYIKDHFIFYDNNIILDNVSDFSIYLQDSFIILKICKENICNSWKLVK